MRILQLISYLYPAVSYGGPGKLVYDIAGALSTINHQVSVFSTDAFDADRRRYFNDNQDLSSSLDIRFFKNINNKFAYMNKAFIAPEAVFTILREVKNFDVLHIHEFFTPMAIAASFAAGKFSIPIVFSAHGTLSSFHLSHKRSVKKIFMKAFGNKMIQNATAFIAATEEEVTEYQKLGVNKEHIYLVKNGIDVNEFQDLPRFGSFRKKYKIKESEIVLLYIGRIHRLKGLDKLVEAVSDIKKQYPVKMVIGGTDDGFLRDLKEIIAANGLSENIILTGKLTGIEKLQALRDADVFVYPSPSEGFSIAILEAGAAGLPLLITKGCKFPEVEAYGAGAVVESTSESLYKGLRYLLKNKSKLPKMGLNAKKLVQQNYSIEKMAQNLEKAYMNLCAE